MQDHRWLSGIIDDLACYAAKHRMAELQAKLFLTKVVAEREILAAQNQGATVSEASQAPPAPPQLGKRRAKLTIELGQSPNKG